MHFQTPTRPQLLFSSDIQNNYCLDPPSYFQRAFKRSCNDFLRVDDETDISEVRAIQIANIITVSIDNHLVEATAHVFAGSLNYYYFLYHP